MDSSSPSTEKQPAEYTTVSGNKFIEGIHPHPWRNVAECSDTLGAVTDRLERSVHLRRTLSDRIGSITELVSIRERHVIQWLKNWGRGSDIAFAVLLAIITTGVNGGQKARIFGREEWIEQKQRHHTPADYGVLNG
jgi:hypothetical protein